MIKCVNLISALP